MPSAAVRVRRRVHEILEIPSLPGDRAGRVFDVAIATLIVLNVAAVMLQTMDGFGGAYASWFMAFEVFSLVVFGTEYVLRLWASVEDPRFARPVVGRARFALTPAAVVDVLAILPALLFVVDLRFLRILRLLRLLKLSRYSRAMRVLGAVVRSRREELVATTVVVGLALVISSSLMFYAEHEAQPDAFSSIPATMWWGIATITTVGYGDVAPVTAAGRVLGGLTALLGVGLVALPVGLLAGSFVEELNRAREETSTACPHCGGDVRAPPVVVASGPRP